MDKQAYFDLRANLGHPEVEAAPRPAPAVRLRFELEAARRAGLSFSEAWPVALQKALSAAGHARTSGQSNQNRKEWHRALVATQSAWRAAYHGLPISDFPIRESLLTEVEQF